MNRWIPITAVATALTAALVAVALDDDAAPAPAAPAAATGSEPSPDVPAPVVAPAATAPAAPAAPAPRAPESKAVATYPDGTRMPALNGAKESVLMPWPPKRPWSPIVDTVVDHGQEWYRHADGCWSTTVTTWDPSAGIYRTSGQLFEPVAPGQPVLRGGS